MVYLFKVQIILFSTFVFFIINSVSGLQNPYSQKELLAIDEFRPMVSKFLTMDFHKTGAYLLRWIRYKNFDLSAAAKRLEKFHTYRASNHIDAILESDGSGAKNPGVIPNPLQYMPYSLYGHDKRGRPIVHVPGGRWNLRKYVIAGKLKIANRVGEEVLERSIRKTFKEAATSGKDIDQVYALVDLNGYNLREMGCIGCIPVLANFARTTLAYGPFWYNVTLVNTPRIFNPVLSLIKSILADKVPLYAYDFDKADWQKKLLKEIALDQLPPRMQ